MTPRAVFAWCGSCENASARIRYFFSDTESGFVCRYLDAVDELDAGPGVVRKQEVAVEIDVIAEARHLCGRRNPEPGLDHAAEHDAEDERARRTCHSHRLTDAARLRELDVDAVRTVGAARDIGKVMTVLVDVDRNRRKWLQAWTIRVSFAQRLLAVLNTELAELRQSVTGLFEAPALVHVDLQRDVRHVTNSAHALDIERVPAAQLELQSREAGCLRRAAGHVVGIAEPDRPRRRRAGAPQTKQP